MTDLDHCATVPVEPEGREAVATLFADSALSDFANLNMYSSTLTTTEPLDDLTMQHLMIWGVAVRLAAGEHLSRCEIESHGDAVDPTNREAIAAAARLVA